MRTVSDSVQAADTSWFLALVFRDVAVTVAFGVIASAHLEIGLLSHLGHVGDSLCTHGIGEVVTVRDAVCASPSSLAQYALAALFVAANDRPGSVLLPLEVLCPCDGTTPQLRALGCI